MPQAVKERFAHRPAFATAIYATGINVGSALSSAAAVPLARAAGGWRASLLVFAAASAVLVPVWLALTSRFPAHRRVDTRVPRLPFRSGIGWVLVLLFGVMGTCFYGLNSWLADSFVERGWSEGSAGALIGVLNIASIPGALLVPWLADRIGSRRPYLVGSAALFAGGALGLAVAPDAGWLFATVTGLGVGGLFPLVLTLPLDVVDRPADVGAYAGLMLGAGYCVAAVAPFALGAVRDATGSFTATLWTIVGLATLLLVACLPLTHGRLHRAGERAP